MLRRTLMLSMLVASVASAADEVAADKAAVPAAAEKAAQVAAARPSPDAGEGKTLSGISILGNQEAPKALVIVPWKSSEIGDPLGLDENLDGSRRPVDREVFMRELDYYDIRSGSK
jgi:hypothetical protein